MMKSTKIYLVTWGISGIGLAIADKPASWISGTTIPLDGGATEENNLVPPKNKQQ